MKVWKNDQKVDVDENRRAGVCVVVPAGPKLAKVGMDGWIECTSLRWELIGSNL